MNNAKENGNTTDVREQFTDSFVNNNMNTLTHTDDNMNTDDVQTLMRTQTLMRNQFDRAKAHTVLMTFPRNDVELKRLKGAIPVCAGHELEELHLRILVAYYSEVDTLCNPFAGQKVLSNQVLVIFHHRAGVTVADALKIALAVVESKQERFVHPMFLFKWAQLLLENNEESRGWSVLRRIVKRCNCKYDKSIIEQVQNQLLEHFKVDPDFVHVVAGLRRTAAEPVHKKAKSAECEELSLIVEPEVNEQEEQSSTKALDCFAHSNKDTIVSPHSFEPIAKVELSYHKQAHSLLGVAERKPPSDVMHYAEELKLIFNKNHAEFVDGSFKKTCERAWKCAARNRTGWKDGVHTWSVRLDKHANEISIGVIYGDSFDSSDARENDHHRLDVYGGTGEAMFAKDLTKEEEVKDMEKKFEDGKMVCVRLDMGARTVSYAVDGVWKDIFREIKAGQWFPYFALKVKDAQFTIIQPTDFPYF